MNAASVCVGLDGFVPSVGFLGCLVLGSGAAVTSSAWAADRLGLEVRETAGLARGGYPAQALVQLPWAVPQRTKFRLLHDGKPVAAQFRPDRAGATAGWWLDFQVNMAPFEVRKYTVEYGHDVAVLAEPGRGHKLSESGDAWVITNAPYITWTMPRDLKGFLRSVDFRPAEFLRPQSAGLVLRDRHGMQHAFSGNARVLRQGTMAVALRFDKAETEAGLQSVSSTADLTFPVPVSWVEVDWNVDDPLDNVAAVGMELKVNLETPSTAAPTLVDFGATSTVYTSLRTGQEAELSAGPANGGDEHAWKIQRGDRERLLPFALGPKPPAPARAEGWAHLMDRKICLALAVEAFGRDAHDRIITTADGTVTLWREYRPAQKPAGKRLHFWLHFVFFPPQYSAGASPQQMQTPLTVRVTKE